MTQNVDTMPEGWTLVQLRDVATSRKGKKPKTLLSAMREGFVPYIDIEAFENDNIRRYADMASSSITDAPELLIVWDGARCGLVGKAKHRGAIGSTLASLRVLECEPSYIFWILRNHYHNINTNERGIGIPHVQPEHFWALEVPLPPLAEQKRIITHIEALLASVNATRERLAKVPAILKRFRQSVLAAACSGQLTEDWRAQQKDLEPASCLLERIREERRVAIGSKYKEPLAPDVSNLPELPEGWMWTTTSHIATVATGATPLRKRIDYFKGGTIPWITSGAVNQSVISRAEEYITEVALIETNVKVFPVGTLVVAMYGEGQTRGRVAELGIATSTNQALAALLFDGVGLQCKPYIKLFQLKNYQDVRNLSMGGVQPNLNLSIIRETSIPLPPLAEQQQITQRVEALFQLANAMEKRIEVARQRADKLTQAVLARAFRGELVPTEAELARQEGREYETAAALLERIKAERVQTQQTNPTRSAERRPRANNAAPTLPFDVFPVPDGSAT